MWILGERFEVFLLDHVAVVILIESVPGFVFVVWIGLIVNLNVVAAVVIDESLLVGADCVSLFKIIRCDICDRDVDSRCFLIAATSLYWNKYKDKTWVISVREAENSKFFNRTVKVDFVK